MDRSSSTGRSIGTTGQPGVNKPPPSLSPPAPIPGSYAVLAWSSVLNGGAAVTIDTISVTKPVVVLALSLAPRFRYVGRDDIEDESFYVDFEVQCPIAETVWLVTKLPGKGEDEQSFEACGVTVTAASKPAVYVPLPEKFSLPDGSQPAKPTKEWGYIERADAAFDPAAPPPPKPIEYSPRLRFRRRNRCSPACPREPSSRPPTRRRRRIRPFASSSGSPQRSPRAKTREACNLPQSRRARSGRRRGIPQEVGQSPREARGVQRDVSAQRAGAPRSRSEVRAAETKQAFAEAPARISSGRSATRLATLSCAVPRRWKESSSATTRRRSTKPSRRAERPEAGSAATTKSPPDLRSECQANDAMVWTHRPCGGDGMYEQRPASGGKGVCVSSAPENLAAVRCCSNRLSSAVIVSITFLRNETIGESVS